ncbi:hypothetical protein Gpo141_00006433 [Globisporangium polare]
MDGFRTGPDSELKTLLDVEKEPIVNLDDEDTEILQIYVKQGTATSSKRGYLDTTLRVDLTDIATGERCKIEIEWHVRIAVWLQRGLNGTRAAVGKIYRPRKALRNGFNLDIAPNVDTALRGCGP